MTEVWWYLLRLLPENLNTHVFVYRFIELFVDEDVVVLELVDFDREGGYVPIGVGG
jgi:hypothetical protein